MADDKKILIDITIDAEALEKSRDKAILAVAGFDKKLSEMKNQRKKDSEELAKAVEQGNQKEIDAINKRTIVAEAESKSIQQSRREQVKVVQLSNDLIQNSDGKSLQSKEQLRKARGLEQIQLDQLKGTIKQNADGQIVLSKAGEQSVQQLNKYNTGLITFGKSVNDGRENVGNYTSSILDAVEKTGLFGGSLGTVREAFNAVRSGAASASDGMKKFKEGISQSVSIVTEWAQSGRVAGEQTETSTVSVGKLGGALEKTGKTGTASMNTLRAAIASTGIGLLVIALAAVFNYLRQIDPVVEKVEQLFAGFGQAVYEVGKLIFDFGAGIVKALTAPMEFIKNFSLDNLKASFNGATEAMVKNTLAAVENKKRMQELEDFERNMTAAIAKNNTEITKNRNLADDRTRSAKERLGFLQLAQDKEKENLALEIEASRKRFQIAKTEIELKGGLASANDELKDSYIKSATELTTLNETLKNKDIADAAEGNRTKLKLQKDYLAGTISLLNEELRTAELQGIASIDLKKEILKKQRDAELTESDLSNEQRRAIEKKFQNDLLELDIETGEKRKAIRDQINQLAIDSIIDGQTRELAAESFALDAKLEAIKGNSQEEQALRVALIEQSEIKILEIEKKYAELSQAEKQKIAESDRALLTGENEKRFRDAENALKISLSKQEITQQEFDERVRNAKVESLQKQLDLELQFQGLRQAQDQVEFERAQSALDEKLKSGTISQKAYNAEILELQTEFYKTQGATEIETQAVVNGVLVELNQTKVDNVIATNDQIIADDQRAFEAKRAIQQAQSDLARTAIDGFIELLGLDEKARKQHAVAIKALTIGSMLVGLGAEISGYWVGAAADSKDGIIVKGSAAAILATQRSITASIRTGVAVAKVAAQKFEHGGYSANDMIRQYNPTFTDSPKGYINRPTAWMNIAGEAGGEWIASNKLLRDPRTAPVIESLERFQRTGVQTFATGGFSAPLIIPRSVQLSAIDVADAVRSAISELHITPIVSVQEIIDVNQQSNNVRAVATL